MRQDADGALVGGGWKLCHIQLMQCTPSSHPASAAGDMHAQPQLQPDT